MNRKTKTISTEKRLRKISGLIREWRNSASESPENRFRQRTPNVVFIWIPKSSGTSLYRQLAKSIGMRKLKKFDRLMSFRNGGAITPGHVSWLSLIRSGIISSSYSDSAYKFAVVRNPYSRAASLYNYLMQSEQTKISFDEFLEEVMFRRPPIGLFNRAGLSQANPQKDWLIGEDGNIFVDEIFKLEDLERLALRFSEKYDVKIDIKKRKNVSKKLVRLDDILKSESRVKMVNEIYRSDFRLFGYSMVGEK